MTTIITDKKINLSLDLSIGEYSLFKKSILDKVNWYGFKKRIRDRKW